MPPALPRLASAGGPRTEVALALSPIDLATIAAGTGGFVLMPAVTYQKVGTSVASAGDVNGDGFDDLIIGAPYAISNAGRSYVVFGKAAGFGASINLAAIAAGTGGFALNGQTVGDYAGYSVASGGDINGDGFADLIVGAPLSNGQAGSSYVVFGQDFLGTVTQRASSGGSTLTGTGGADDMVGAQGDDILIGNGGADVLLGAAGNDVIRVSDLTFQRADGGSGTDTLALAGAGMSLDLTGAIAARVRSFERIDLTGTGNNALTLSALAVRNLSSTSNTLRLLGDAGDSVDLKGAGWTQGATAGGFTSWTNGSATAELAVALSVACFARGTLIRTTGGEVAVEALTTAHRVVTRAGLARPVRWVGHRTLAPARHPRPWDVQPVRVAAGAFGPGRPARDLWLSPDHAVFAGGSLIPVRYLLNGATVVQESVARVTYYHVELAGPGGAAAHDVLLAEGLACESFLDTGNRGAFANGGANGGANEDGAMALHPDFALRVWESEACATLVREGAVLDAVRAALFARAEEMGHRMTSDPEVCLWVDGRAVAGCWDGDRVTLAVPQRARVVRLVSRPVVPAQMRAGCDDHRTLGVAVTSLWVDGCRIGLDDAVLCDGWHALEDGLRWTDGDAALPCGGGAIVEVGTAGLERYWTAAEPALAVRARAA